MAGFLFENSNIRAGRSGREYLFRNRPYYRPHRARFERKPSLWGLERVVKVADSEGWQKRVA